MTGQNEIEIHKKLLGEAEATLKVEQGRMDNIRTAILDAKKKVFEKMELGFWDDAQTALLQAKVLHIKMQETESNLSKAEARVDTLKNALRREQERDARIPVAVYQPYQPSPKDTPAAPEAKTEAPKTPYSPEPK